MKIKLITNNYGNVTEQIVDLDTVAYDRNEIEAPNAGIVHGNNDVVELSVEDEGWEACYYKDASGSEFSLCSDVYGLKCVAANYYEADKIINLDDDEEIDPQDIYSILRSKDLSLPDFENAEINYDNLAASYIEEMEGFTYHINRERGFGNEWTLYVVENGYAGSEAEFEELDAEEAADYIADAVMRDEDYRGKYLADSHVCAIEVFK